MPRLLAYFVRGLVVLTPIAITAYVVWMVLHKIDGWLGIETPGVGLLITVALIVVVGILASTVITRSFVSFLEGLLAKLPFVRLLYTSSKDLLNAFVGEHRRFDRPALVSVAPNVQIMGFVTQSTLSNMPTGSGTVAVYCPQSYHWAGQLIVVPASQVTPLDASAADVLAFIVSGGVTGRPFGESASLPAKAEGAH